MKIRDVMRHDVITIDRSRSIGDAHQLMTKHGVRHLPVVRDGKLVGMLSERDVLHVRAAADDGEWWRVPVEIAMSSPVHTANPDDSLTAVAARLAAEKLGALPIVDAGKLLGIVSVTDVLAAEARLAMAPRGATRIAADAMTPSPITVRSRTRMTDAIRTMVQARIRHLPVLDAGDNLIGIISDRDVQAIASDPSVFAHGRAGAEPYVDDILTSHPATARFDTPLDELARRIADERLEAVLVTDSLGAMIGIVSYVDVLRALAA